MTTSVAIRPAARERRTYRRTSHFEWVDVAVDGGSPGGDGIARFHGRWILPPGDDTWSGIWPRTSTCYGIGGGSDGSVYVYAHDPSARTPRTLTRYDSLLSALAAGIPADIVAQAVGSDRMATAWLQSYLRDRAG